MTFAINGDVGVLQLTMSCYFILTFVFRINSIPINIRSIKKLMHSNEKKKIGIRLNLGFIHLKNVEADTFGFLKH